MIESIKQEWIEALRSGEYQQGEGSLQRINGGSKYCCLGVLCDLYINQHYGEAFWSKAGRFLFIEMSGDTPYFAEQGGTLPRIVREWSGIPNQVGAFKRKDHSRTSLVSLNDSGQNFEEIADKIEEYF